MKTLFLQFYISFWFGLIKLCFIGLTLTQGNFNMDIYISLTGR